MKVKISNELLSSGTLMPKEKPYEVYDARLPGFFIRVQPSGRMTFYYRYRLTSHQQNRFRIARVGDITPAHARMKAEELLAKVINGSDPAFDKSQARLSAKCTVLKILEEEYRPWAETHLRSGKGNVIRIKSCFAEFLHKPISDNNFRWLIDKWRLARQKAGIKKITIDRDVAALKAFFSFAKERGAISINPLAGLKPLRRADHDDEDATRKRYLGMYDKNEEERFWAAIEARENRHREKRRSANEWRRERNYELQPSLDSATFTDYVKPMIVITLNTGIRPKELFNLKWLNINFPMATMTIPGEIAKNKKTRHIPLNVAALQAFSKWKTLSSFASEYDLIFPGKDGAVKNNIKNAWKGIVKEAQLIDFRWYDMRHDFASKLVMRGVELNRVRELLGHADFKMTLRYAHLSPKKLAEAVDVLCEYEKVESKTITPIHRQEKISRQSSEEFALSG